MKVIFNFIRFSLFFSLVMGSVTFAQGRGNIERSAVVSVGVAAKKGISKAVKSGKIGGNIAVVQTTMMRGSLPYREIRALVEEIEFATKEIGSVIFVFNYEQLERSKEKKMFAGRKGGILIEKDESVKLAKKMGASYFATLDIMFKAGRSISVVMNVFDNETKVKEWSGVWTVRLADISFFYDFTLESFIKAPYFWGATVGGGMDISNIATVSLRLGTLLALGKVVQGEDEDSYSEITKLGDEPLFGSDLTVKGSVFSFMPQIEATFSLINVFLPHITVFDLEVLLRGGVSLDLLSTSKPARYGDKSETGFLWRPVFITGLNMLFAERFYMFAGADFGGLMKKNKAMGIIPKERGIIPVAGLGFKFEI